jgi:phage terminase large subunit-like protein
MGLPQLARVAFELKDRAARRPLDFWSPTPPQHAWLSDASTAKLLRGGNQVGKSSAAIAETIWRATGTHPYLSTHKVPVEIWIVVHSWESSKSLQKKFHEMAPKDELHPDTEYVPGRGYRGKVPVILFKNGSLVRIKTTSQGSLGLASATIHAVFIDEPPPPSIWGELQARVLRTGGVIGLTITPVGAPVGWLRKLVEEGVVTDHQAALTVANTTPIGGRALLAQSQIDRVAKSYLPIDRPQRVDGAWEGSTEGRVFEAFTDEQICDLPLPDLPDGAKPYQIGIGIDHGADAGTQVAVLVAVDKSGQYPKIFVLDEYVAGAASPEAHARGMIKMLHRNGMTHNHVDKWVGDRAYGGKRHGGKMSNARLMKGLEAVLNMKPGRLSLRIRTAWKPRWSVYHGSNVIHECMERDNFIIRSCCKQAVRSLKHWQFRDDEYKHSIDAIRYAAVTIIQDKFRAPVRIKFK